MKKKIKDGSLYFRQKDILRPVGAVLLPVGLVVVYFTWGILFILGALASVAGLAMFIVGGAKYISDNDVAEQIDHAMQDYDRPVTDMPGYERAVLKQPAPFEITAYSFGEDAKYFKRGKNSTPVSDRLTRTHIFYTKDTLLVVGRTLSLAELNEATGEGITDFEEQLLLTGITSASLETYETTVTLTNTGKPLTVKWCELVLMGAEGELLRIPAKNDMDAAGLVEDINVRAERMNRA
ncbi:MAG: hypothetical protein J6M42_12845 [Clostridia bacterium]|nr:hypothetical protein [Clostridia bacterium]